MLSIQQKIEQSTNYIQTECSDKPTIGLILGSGLGAIADKIEDATKISYSDIPHFPVSTVKGHAGQLVIGKLKNKIVIAMQGRFHYYEGYNMGNITFPVRVMKKLGVEKLIVTNAAGAVNKTFSPGDLMIISDHLNLQGTNPLIGKNIENQGTRFPDMSTAYNPALITIALNAGKKLNAGLREGVYACMTGPSFETPAEIRMLRTMGADAVGMSTAPEVIVANHAGIKCLGISCMTNMATGVLDQPLNHEEVIETSTRIKDLFINLMVEIIHNI